MRALVAALVVCVMITSANAQTAADIKACKDDAIDICNATLADLFDQTRIGKCMRDNKARLSPQCLAVVNRHSR